VIPFAHGGRSAPYDPLQWLLPAVVVLVAVGVYAVGMLAYQARRGRPWSTWRATSWLVGTSVVALALSPALDEVVTAARGHMAQHLLLGMLGPLGLVMGAPISLLLGSTAASVGRAVSRALRSRVVHVATHPVSAAVLHMGGLFALYLTPLYAASVEHDVVHHVVHVHFLAAGCLFAWAIAGPDPAPHRPGIGTRTVVLVLAAGAHSYLGKLLYARAGELPQGAGHSSGEMEVAAQWMYYGGDVAELLLAAALFATWYRQAGRTARTELQRA
jgi:putative membrane protein